MKNILFLAIIILFVSCKNNTKETVNYSEKNLDVTTSVYPENISKIFKAHGGLDTWNSMQSLTFTMAKPNGDEVTTTDLKSRRSLIEMPKHTIGFNGKDVWLHSKDTTAYKGNAKFYYNLMFYFYAMPFVLADDGIIYKDVEPLVFEGKSYPGIKISYESGVGESPEDEYVLYYDSETNQMAWLSYTVTYFSKEKSKEFKFIKYSNWQTVEELLLPKTLTWYNYENNVPTKKRSDVNFTNIKLSKEKPNNILFESPEGAKIIE
ncbi:DUF6503 family protein [Flavivirga spongiicola]|uniref:Threonine synthase n=1 Tax=Flavivirga spongiicola TaxID=421621 RepID=A0ABU7XPE3_9FLAO|nr:DUF6503 family protein [Flavivirga sp. MEBiC05379]MDO5977649.1 hypothetical protein [Flavivirga sp. MEBiC05379]